MERWREGLEYLWITHKLPCFILFSTICDGSLAVFKIAVRKTPYLLWLAGPLALRFRIHYLFIGIFMVDAPWVANKQFENMIQMLDHMQTWVVGVPQRKMTTVSHYYYYTRHGYFFTGWAMDGMICAWVTWYPIECQNLLFLIVFLTCFHTSLRGT